MNFTVKISWLARKNILYHTTVFLLYLSFDSVAELKKLEWVNPLRNLCEECVQNDDKFSNAIMGFESYFKVI